MIVLKVFLLAFALYCTSATIARAANKADGTVVGVFAAIAWAVLIAWEHWI